MLSRENLEKAEKLVKTSSKAYYCMEYDPVYGTDFPRIKVEHKRNLTIRIVDDRFEWFRFFDIELTSDDRIRKLHIIIESGKFFDEMKEEYDEGYGYEPLSFNFKSHNSIDELIISQEVQTEDRYSYYGNQDGYVPSTINVFYNTDVYRNVEFNGDLNIKGSSKHFIHEDRPWHLLIKTV